MSNRSPRQKNGKQRMLSNHRLYISFNSSSDSVAGSDIGGQMTLPIES